MKATHWQFVGVLKNSIQKWLNRKDASKAELASAIGRSRSYVTRLERGEIRPSVEAMFRIAEFFGCPVEAVFQHVANENEPAAFFTSKVLPSGQRKSFTPALAKPLYSPVAAPPARPVGMVQIKGQIVGRSNGEGCGVACRVVKPNGNK